MNQLTIKEYPLEERPVEKMRQRGMEALSDEELLAILIGSGTPERNALELAGHILHGPLPSYRLLQAEMNDLMAYPGIGDTKAARILAGIHLGKRLTESRDFQAISLSSPQTVADYFSSVYLTEGREVFCAIFLDTKNRPIRMSRISVGTLNQTVVHPREVFRPAIQLAANALILSHNHPSGDPEPSREDIEISQRLAKSGKIIGISVLDHVIVGRRRYVSLRERNLL